MTTVSIFSIASRCIATAAMAGGLLLGAGASHADATAAAPPQTERCVQLNRIRDTKVVDEKTVLFYMRQNEIYKNVLPNKCGALKNEQAFRYKSSTNNLCSVDIITPLVRAGDGYMATAGCGLGTFERIDKATAEKLMHDAKVARTGN